jgi:hypothetical protein
MEFGVAPRRIEILRTKHQNVKARVTNGERSHFPIVVATSSPSVFCSSSKNDIDQFHFASANCVCFNFTLELAHTCGVSKMFSAVRMYKLFKFKFQVDENGAV